MMEEVSGRKKPSYAASLASGALAGLSVDLLFYPIDTLKTRLQSSQGFIQAGGFSGIYRGIGSVAVGSAPGAACFFVTYETLKPALSSLYRDEGRSLSDSSTASALVHMTSASVAEVAACLIRVPTEVVKSRQQTSAYGHKISSFKAFRAVLKEQGARGLYAGFAGTIGREIPFTCIQFPLYEHLKIRIARSSFFQALDSSHSKGTDRGVKRDGRSIPTWQAGLAGSMAGAIAAGLTTPLDVVKTRIMLNRKGKLASVAGVNVKILPTLRHIYTTEGGRALFSGFTPRVIWIGLGGFVFLGTFEAGIKMM